MLVKLFQPIFYFQCLGDGCKAGVSIYKSRITEKYSQPVIFNPFKYGEVENMMMP